MRVHLLGLPHTETTREFEWCAFTAKVRRLATMLHSLGHEVFLYAGEQNEAEVTEHIPVIDRAWQLEMFGERDIVREVFNDFDPASRHWTDFNARTIEAIRSRMRPMDFLFMSMGQSQRPVAEALPDLVPVESGIGYSGVWAPFRVYESYAWMHHVAGLYHDDDAKFFQTVIPNSFEAEAFPAGSGDGGYYVFLGRFIRRKGIQIAVEATTRAGVPLVMAGQGLISRDGQTFRGIDVEVSGPLLGHIGVVNPAERARLLGGAIAVFAPSIYLEPFCGVHVEAMMCGTPVITTDWGVFTETVVNGFNGFRCNTLRDFVEAMELVKDLDRGKIRRYAQKRWSTETVRFQYDSYLRRLATLTEGGWYEMGD